MLETQRLIIREMCPADVDAIYKIYEDNDLKYMEKLYEDKEQERQYIADYQKYIYNFYDFGIWLFEEKDTGEVIGRGGVEYKRYEGTGKQEALEEAIELGYIIRKDKQRQGYAYEGLSAILKYVAEHFEVGRVKVSVHRDNIPSMKLAEKLGARFEDLKDGKSEYISGIMEFIIE